MASTGHKGLAIRQTGTRLVFRSQLDDNAGDIVTSGTTNLTLYELQDTALLSYDFASNTFKSTALSTPNLAMTHQTGNNGSTNTGIWLASLSILTGFTIGNRYLAVIRNSGAYPIQRTQEFQYGGGEGDTVVTQGTTGLGYTQIAVAQLDYSAINGTTRGFIAQSWLFGSGSTSPNISVTFTPAGITTNGRQTYSSVGGAGYYISWSSVDSQWIISGAPGLTTGSYWISSGGINGMLGPYTPAGGATGTPTFTAIGRPLSAYWSSMSLDSSGRLLLQPTQTGVTIPTVTSLTTSPDSSGISTLLTRLSDSRAGFLDNLDVDGAVASQADLETITAAPTVVEIREEIDANSTQLAAILDSTESITPVPDLIPVNHNYGGENAMQYTDPDGNGIAGARVLVFTVETYQRSVSPVPPESWAIGSTTTIANGAWANYVYLGVGNYVAVFSLPDTYQPAVAHFVVGEPVDSDPPDDSNGNSWLV